MKIENKPMNPSGNTTGKTVENNPVNKLTNKPENKSRHKPKNKIKTRQYIVRTLRWIVQIICFILAPSLFSTAFTGIRTIFISLAGYQEVQWNSFLTVTAALLLLTCLTGRHFCGWACAFGTLGDFVYTLSTFVWTKIFRKKKKPGFSHETVHKFQKMKYFLLAFLNITWITGYTANLHGSSPWEIFSTLLKGKLPPESHRIGLCIFILILIGMCFQERFFCQFLCPMGAIFAMMPAFPYVLPRRKRDNCPSKCTLCKNRCPAHLSIDGDTPTSGECICCHACVPTCPRGNLSLGLHKNKT